MFVHFSSSLLLRQVHHFASVENWNCQLITGSGGVSAPPQPQVGSVPSGDRPWSLLPPHCCAAFDYCDGDDDSDDLPRLEVAHDVRLRYSRRLSCVCAANKINKNPVITGSRETQVKGEFSHLKPDLHLF